MKKAAILFALIICFLASASAALAQKGLFAVGGNLAISFDSETFYAGISPKAQYYFSDHFRGEGAATFFLPKNSLMYLDIAVYAHYLFDINDQARIYPVVGTGIYALSREKSIDLSAWPTLAVGGGIEYDFNERWTINGELKYKIASNTSYSFGMLSMGLAYKF
ncbi:MAG: porin family protein [Tannerellaceae bacterium]|jgi:opacity protein-like surface antigen|nr:porin family protein [Tannerellaceae bacterium]